MKKILAFFGAIGAVIIGIFFKNRAEITKILKRQDDEVKTSEDKLDTARNDIKKAVEALKEENGEVSDLDDDEVEDYWKKKLQ